MKADDFDEVFHVRARRCRRCGGILISSQAIEDGYGRVCKIKTQEEEQARRPIAGQMSLFDRHRKQEETNEY